MERISASDVIRLMAMKIRLKMTNRSQRYDINRPRHILGPKCSKCKMLSIMMVICIKRHLSNIWSSIHEKVHESNTDDELKGCLYKKSVQLGSQHKYVERPVRPVFPDCLSVSCDYDST